MLIEKNISFLIQLSAKEAYSGPKTIMKKLAQFENICISNSLIKRIISIENIGPRLPVTSNVKGDVQTEVLAKVLCHVFSEGNILACKIRFIDPGKMIYGEYIDNIFTNIRNVNSNLNLNEIVIVRILKVMFQQYSTSVSIMCELVESNPNSNPISSLDLKLGYKIVGAVNDDTKKYIETLTLVESDHPLAFKLKGLGGDDVSKFVYNPQKMYNYSMGKIFEVLNPTSILTVDINIFLVSAVDYFKQQSEINTYLNLQSQGQG